MAARILIVDDEPFLRRILTYMLTGAGHQVECAEDGEQAWVRLGTMDPPDLIISDLMMPGMSGMDLVRKLRQERGNRTPVLILTARGQRFDEDEARTSGADAFMTKPFSSHELLERVRSLLEMGAAREKGHSEEATGTDG